MFVIFICTKYEVKKLLGDQLRLTIYNRNATQHLSVLFFCNKLHPTLLVLRHFV